MKFKKIKVNILPSSSLEKKFMRKVKFSKILNHESYRFSFNSLDDFMQFEEYMESNPIMIEGKEYDYIKSETNFDIIEDSLFVNLKIGFHIEKEKEEEEDIFLDY